ncbi:hypothetical protein [Paraclostridium sordellii]|nr:hypothetical protein [Paeniclostridium sordellii]CEN26230.1 Uncharacterised protein [[Clostridium] sordellii] [Paeniclostridium sordellii]
MKKVSFLLDEEVLKEVRQIAVANDRSVGFILRNLVDKGLNKK